MTITRTARTAVAVLGLLATAVAAEAQSTGKTARIGVLFLSSPASTAWALEGLRSGLRELGHVEGRTFIIDFRSAEGRAERLPELAAQLVERKVDIMVTGGGNVSTLAARSVTKTIPIIMAGGVSAVESGLVESLARPGGNVTGVSVPRELGEKQMGLLRELIPSLSRVAILLRANPATAPQRAQAKASALEFLRLTLEYVDVAELEDLTRALAAVRAFRPHAVLVGPDPLFFLARDRLIDFARTNRLPAIYPFRDFVDAGGLISYSLSRQEVIRTIARYVDRILKGAKPADLPVEQPTTFDLAINKKTAKALGVTIPPSILLAADHVVE